MDSGSEQNGRPGDIPEVTTQFSLGNIEGAGNSTPVALPEIDGYQVIREANQGGQAIVYLALHKSTGRKVAVKVLKKKALSEKDRHLMDREVRVLAELDHSNIVSVFDRGVTRQGQPYFVMEFIQGENLREFADAVRIQHDPRHARDLLQLFVRICEAVNAAHLRGIVHRDLKPSNIIIDGYGEPHILDFGLAHGAAAWLFEDVQPSPSDEKEFLGSLAWASPEQADGDEAAIDTRTDVYSLGVVLYYLTTGKLPYSVTGDARQVLNNIIGQKPELPSHSIRGESQAVWRAMLKKSGFIVDARLDAVIMKALEKDKARRYQSAGELANDLKRFLAGKPVMAMEGTQSNISFRRLTVAVVAVCVVATIGFLEISKRSGTSGEAPSVVPAAAVPAPPPVAPEPPMVRIQRAMKTVWGYSIQEGAVIFEFNPGFYDILRGADGKLGPVPSADQIKQVSIAGPFNNWTPGHPDWILTRSGLHDFFLKKPLSDFQDKVAWPFKFVVDGTGWVSAPDNADNREGVTDDADTFNLLLVNPESKSLDEFLAIYEQRMAINTAWPGMGSFLVQGEDGLGFTLQNIPVGVSIRDLLPLKGIPIESLHMGGIFVEDFSPLADPGTVQSIFLGEKAASFLVGQALQGLKNGDYERAQLMLDQRIGQFLGVPAFENYRSMFSDAITAFKEMETEPMKRPSTARSFLNHHYLLVPVPMTWVEANEFCQARGAYLAAINSRPEQRWIQRSNAAKALGPPIWLGGTDEAVEGQWAWSSGDPWDFENWTGQEPNNVDSAEHALIMQRDGWWFDENGSTREFPFVMEWPY